MTATSKEAYKREWETPHLREAHQFPAMERASQDFWSVKFYPFTEAGLDPVFAVVGGTRILICRTPTGEEKEKEKEKEKENSQMEVLRMILDDDVDANNYACTWTKNLETGAPLLCVAGHTGIIKIFDVLTGELLRTLAGHGGEINDLVISPINPYILASCSEDCTVRVWSLDPAHASQPCAAILEGDGHKDNILTLSFHDSGRYLLSGAADHIIMLWTLPEFPDANTGTNIPTRIFYPHFSTAEVHADCVDCVAWWGDLVLSKASNENTLVLWSINKFPPSSPPPPTTAPTLHQPHRDTRSAFVTPLPASSTNNAFSLYTRHLHFSLPDSCILFTRFSLFPGLPPPPSPPAASASSPARSPPLDKSHPILAFCNTKSKIMYWDLARLERYFDDEPYLPTSKDGTVSHPNLNSAPLSRAQIHQMPTPASPHAHPFLRPSQRRGRRGALMTRVARNISPSESASSYQTASDLTGDRDEPSSTTGTGTGTGHASGKGSFDWVRSRKLWAREYDMREPARGLQRHREDIVRGVPFAGRQVAWSPCGEWCVVVGSHGVMAVSQRWKES
ncbi:uncharacterized protein L3040_002062 [Drepanopeziza brunnea f. sp. 'multigermtubi']|uniref:uncharacterized protein n=1 Tax=Drepanopeziza brunnea f. sp. 'multigermtubi' TaxID=698441 RepID=UPI0023A4F63F|nr:hypothetical protein L3040_002062 [Drepanopeziza brunnea f. sp. 'multigermtubi']